MNDTSSTRNTLFEVNETLMNAVTQSRINLPSSHVSTENSSLTKEPVAVILVIMVKKHQTKMAAWHALDVMPSGILEVWFIRPQAPERGGSPT